MKSELSSLQEKKEAFGQMKKNYEESVAHMQVRSSGIIHHPVISTTRFIFRLSSQVQARFVERCTREEFEKLRSFLQAEEEERMAALKAEEELKSRESREKIEEMTRLIASVSESIRVLEEEMSSEGISVLHVRSQRDI